jgi:hypothetical protein
MKVELHIEALVLHGLAREESARIGEALQRELARLLAEGGLAPGLAKAGDFPHLDGGAFSFSPGAAAEATGARIAQSVYQSFSVPGHP